MKTALNVYSSGAPHYFTYGISDEGNTYSLIDNQYWIQSSTNITDDDLSKMFLITTEIVYIVKD